MICCPENLLHDYSTTVTFHFPSNTDMQSHTLGVVIIWNCLIQKSTNTHIFLATFSALLSHRDWVPEFPFRVPICAWPFSFLYPALPHFLPYELFFHLYPWFLPLMLLLPPLTRTLISRSVIQSVFSIMRSKQLNPGESETFEKIDHIRDSQFSASAPGNPFIYPWSLFSPSLFFCFSFCFLIPKT